MSFGSFVYGISVSVELNKMEIVKVYDTRGTDQALLDLERKIRTVDVLRFYEFLKDDNYANQCDQNKEGW